MIECISGGWETDLVCRGIPNHWCRFCFLQNGGDLHSPTSFQEAWCGKRAKTKRNFTVEKPGIHIMSPGWGIKATIHGHNQVDSMYSHDILWGEWHFASAIFLPKTCNPRLTVREGSGKFQQKAPSSGIPDPCSSKLSRSSKARKAPETTPATKHLRPRDS